jgi:hypothetical protein
MLYSKAGLCKQEVMHRIKPHPCLHPPTLASNIPGPPHPTPAQRPRRDVRLIGTEVTPGTGDRGDSVKSWINLRIGLLEIFNCLWNLAPWLWLTKSLTSREVLISFMKYTKCSIFHKLSNQMIIKHCDSLKLWLIGKLFVRPTAVDNCSNRPCWCLFSHQGTVINYVNNISLDLPKEVHCWVTFQGKGLSSA